MKLVIAVAVISALVTGVSAYKIHGWRVDSLKSTWEEQKKLDLAAAKEAVQKICDENNQLTKESAHALKLKLDATTARYYSLLKYNPAREGVTAPSGAAGGNDGASQASMPSLCLPVATAANLGKLSDDQAAALITLQDVVAGIYKANGQADLLPKEYQ